MKKSVQQLARDLKKANGRHERWQPYWQDCYDFALPNRDDMYQAVAGEDRVSDIYDDTAVNALQDFAGMMHESYFPPFGHIFEMVPGHGVPDEQRPELVKTFKDISAEVHTAIHESNAHSEIADAFTDYGIGTFNMAILPDPGPQGVRFQAHPLSATRLLNSAYGDVGMSAFRVKESPRVLQGLYPGISMSQNQRANMDDPIEVWDVVYRDEESAMAPVFHRHVVDFKESEPSSEMLYVELEGRGSNPRIHGRFTKGVGEVYGRGPAYNTLASIKTTNLSAQLVLENADLGVGGIWKAPHDGIVNPETIELVAGTVIPYMPGSNGLESVQSPVNFDVSQFISAEYRQFIRRGFYVEDFQGQGKTPISSREVQERQVLMKQRLGRPFLRGINEILMPTIYRVMYVLNRMGRIELPVDDTGRLIQFRIVSPLARALKADEILRKTDYVRAVNSTVGPQQAQMILNAPEIVKDITDLFEQPASYVRNEAGINSQVQTLQQLGGLSGAGPTPTIPGTGELA